MKPQSKQTYHQLKIAKIQLTLSGGKFKRKKREENDTVGWTNNT